MGGTEGLVENGGEGLGERRRVGAKEVGFHTHTHTRTYIYIHTQTHTSRSPPLPLRSFRSFLQPLSSRSLHPSLLEQTNFLPMACALRPPPPPPLWHIHTDARTHEHIHANTHTHNTQRQRRAASTTCQWWQASTCTASCRPRSQDRRQRARTVSGPWLLGSLGPCPLLKTQIFTSAHLHKIHAHTHSLTLSLSPTHTHTHTHTRERWLCTSPLLLGIRIASSDFEQHTQARFTDKQYSFWGIKLSSLAPEAEENDPTEALAHYTASSFSTNLAPRRNTRRRIAPSNPSQNQPSCNHKQRAVKSQPSVEPSSTSTSVSKENSKNDRTEKSISCHDCQPSESSVEMLNEQNCAESEPSKRRARFAFLKSIGTEFS